MALYPVYCTHKVAKPPKGKRRSERGIHIVDTLPSAVVTVPWCQSDHRPST